MGVLLVTLLAQRSEFWYLDKEDKEGISGEYLLCDSERS